MGVQRLDRFQAALQQRSLDLIRLDVTRNFLVDAGAALLALQSCVGASKRRELLVLHTLRRAMECCVHDNALIPSFAPLIHDIASMSNGTVGSVACGLLLLFAHGLGQIVPSNEVLCGVATVQPSLVVLLLGPAGGVPSDLFQYSKRLYGPAQRLCHVCASEIPAVFEKNLEHIGRLSEAAGEHLQVEGSPTYQ